MGTFGENLISNTARFGIYHGPPEIQELVDWKKRHPMHDYVGRLALADYVGTFYSHAMIYL